MTNNEIWKYRTILYTGLAICIGILLLWSYFSNPQDEDSEFIKEWRKINASFFPPDMVPHPNLPEPDIPPPGTPTPPWDYA